MGTMTERDTIQGTRFGTYEVIAAAFDVSETAIHAVLAEANAVVEYEGLQ